MFPEIMSMGMAGRGIGLLTVPPGKSYNVRTDGIDNNEVVESGCFRDGETRLSERANVDQYRSRSRGCGQRVDIHISAAEGNIGGEIVSRPGQRKIHARRQRRNCGRVDVGQSHPVISVCPNTIGEPDPEIAGWRRGVEDPPAPGVMSTETDAVKSPVSGGKTVLLWVPTEFGWLGSPTMVRLVAVALCE